MLEKIINTLPKTNLDELFHIGTMDINNRSEHTYEGHMGLSVSRFPDEWGMIASLGGDVYELINKNGTFFDYHKLSEDMWNDIFHWAVKEGYLAPHTYFAFDYEDCEWEMMLRSTYKTKNEALEEAGGEHDVFPIQSYAGTDKYAKMVGERQRDDPKLILTVIAKLHDDIDGVFWEDTLDVNRLSAPRAIILNERLSRWAISYA
jgi:hypothetical protein